MSTNIDTNVVQLKFDNKQFEENCKQSMSTLEKLRQSINESNSGKALNDLNKVDLSGVEKSIDKLNNHFSLLGIAALKVKSSIVDGFLGMAKTLATTVPNIIKQGGWQRAMNIEQAKFMLEGLHVAWKDIKGDIEYAVDGTAYGLDAAAKAASQLVASNVQVGDSMKTALRAISGVAAMTNSEYEAIAPIFTAVAGQGKVMTMQLRQLENRGLNAAAKLAESMHTTEAAVREMVTEGEIDFDTFAKAMDEAFGEHAKDANRTFTGVTANIRAALKKIGADFASPVIEQDGPVVQALQKLRERINDVRASLGPLTKVWTEFVYRYAHDAKVLLQNMDMSFMQDVAQGLTNIFKGLVSVLDPVRYAFADVFLNNKGIKGIEDMAKAFSNLTAKLILSDSEMQDLRSTIRGVLSVGDILVTVIKQILGAILRIKPESVNIREIILKITGTIGDLITYVSQLIKQTNIIEPAIKGISSVLNVVIGLAAIAIDRIIALVSYISRLEITPKIINGIEIAVKGLIGGIVLLTSSVIRLINGGVKELPNILHNISTGLKEIMSWLSNLSIINSAINTVKRLTDAFMDLINPKVKDDNGLVKTVTIVDDAVALAGPPIQKASKLEGPVNKLVTIKDKLVDFSKGIVTFIKNLDYGAIAAVSFTVAIAGIGYKLAQTFQAVSETFDATSNAINQVAGVIGSLKNRSIVELIFGKHQEPQKQNHFLLEFAAAIVAVAGSVKLLSTINSNKLEEIGLMLGKVGIGVAGLVTLLTILQKVLGKGESLAISGVLFSISGSIALMVAALATATKIDYTNIQKAGAAIVQLSIVLGGMSVALSVLAPKISKGALSLIAMALSIKILIGALDKLAHMQIEARLTQIGGRKLWAKGGALATLAAGLVVISGIASKLGTNSLIGIVAALLSIKMIIPLANSIAKQIQNSVFADIWNKMVDFFVNIKSDHPKLMAGIAAFIAIGAAIAGIIGAIYLIKKAFIAIKNLSSTISQTSTKFAGLQKALSRLSLVPVIVALTGMMVAIGVLAVVIGKIKLNYLNQVIVIMAAIGGIFLSLAAVVAASKDAKPTAIMGAMVGITMLFSELIVLTLLVEKHWAGMIVACALMATIMHELSNVFDSLAEASEVSGKSLVAVGMIAAIVAELGGIIYLLSGQDWESVAASGAAMYLALKGITNMLSELGETGQTFGKEKMKILAETLLLLPVIGIALEQVALTHDWSAILAAGVSMGLVLKSIGVLLSDLGDTGQRFGKEKMKILAETILLLPFIGGALALATLTHDWKAMLAAGASMSLVMAVMGGMMKIISGIQWNAGAWKAIVGIAVSAIAIGGALALATLSHDWEAIRMAAIAMSGVMIVFGGMTYLLSKMDIQSAATAFVALLSISLTATLVGAALTNLANYPWQDILTAAGIMAGVVAVLGVIAVGLGAFMEFAIPGALALDLLAVAMLGISTAISTLLNALTLFLPVANAFISGVLGTLVGFAPSLPDVGSGLLSMSIGLAAVGAAGIVLSLGAVGLTAAAIGLNLLIPACQGLNDVNLIPLADGLAALVVPGIAMALVGPAMTVAAAGITIATVALAAFTVVLASFNAVIAPAMKSFDAIKKKAEEAVNWGKDLVQNFINGIKSKIKNLEAAAKEVAKTIWDYIHFTTPEKGPLSDADTYGGDFVDVLCDGITDSIPELEGVMDKLGGTMEGSLEDIDLASIGDQLGIDLGSGTLDSLMPYINRIKNQIAGVQNQVRNGYGQVSKGGSVYRGAAGESLLTQRLRAERKAAQETTPVIDDYTKSVGSAGGGSSKAAKEVKDLSDAFKTVERGTKVNLGNMINSLKENYIETATWAQDMKNLMGKGYDKAITDWVMKMGVAGHETVKALNSGTAEEVVVLNAAMKQYLTLDEDAEKYILGQYDAFGGQIIDAVSGSLEVYSTKLAETIQSAIDPFKEFNDKTDLSAEQMLENMRSQITGVTQWSDNVISLMGRVPEELIQYFQDLGPASYEEVNAMASMTETQLAEAVTLWNQQLALGQTLALQQAQKYREVGMAASDGYGQGMDFNKVYEDGKKLGEESIAGTKHALDSNSPSRVYHGIGEDTIRGLENGLMARKHILVNLAIMIGTDMIDETKRIINWEAGKGISDSLMEGLTYGVTHGESGVISSIQTMATNAIAAAKTAFDINSPSKVFRKIGLEIDEGLGQGIYRGTNDVTSSIDNMRDETVGHMSSVIAQISESINNEFDGLSPVIRPRLDLTEIQNGKDYMHSMFNNPAYQMANTIAAGYSVNRGDASVPILPNNSDVVSAINDLRSDLNSMTEQITNMQVMLDGQTLVGELTPAIDSALGTNAMRVGRGN